MDVFEAFDRRRTTRRYKAEELPRKDLLRLLEAARHAPSGMNAQPWELVAVTAPEGKKALVPACNGQEFVGSCSAVIAGVDDPKAKWQRVDLALAMEHIVLAATDLGLGTCYIGAFSQEKVKKLLGVPEGRQVVMLLTVGYPAEKPQAQPKKPLDKLVHWEKY
jgi:nitroreductase